MSGGLLTHMLLRETGVEIDPARVKTTVAALRRCAVRHYS
jgi:ribosomal protein L12E/L44/L45/RPP1/RPP2